MANGTVKWFSTTQGFGFIDPGSDEINIFVHISAFERSGPTTLANSQNVTCEIEFGRDGGESATNLALA